jgi:hypothetical protein
MGKLDSMLLKLVGEVKRNINERNQNPPLKEYYSHITLEGP